MATTIFAVGSNGSGQLGILHRQDVSVPKPAAFDPAPPRRVAGLAAGGNHTLVVGDSGDVYWAGDAAAGACGLTGHLSEDTDDTDAAVFRKIELGLRRSDDEQQPRVVKAAATWEASILVATDARGKARDVYTLGTGHKGELGQGELVVRTPSASLLDFLSPDDPDIEIVDVAAGMAHAVVVLSNGDVYGWGAARKGQLGEPAETVLFRPRRVDVGFKAVRAVCGRDFTALFAAPEDGNVVVLGADKWGMGGVGDSVKDWVDVGASWGALYVLDKEGRVRGWGRDDHGGLPPPGLPQVNRLVPGSEHVVALTTDGDVVAWGWGEHGNCGPTAADIVDIKGTWNVIASKQYIPEYCEIVGVGAGCATSFVYITGLR
jgi:protein ATS1